MAKPIRIAIIGMGKIARDKHLPALSEDDRFELVATVDPLAGTNGLEHFPDLASLLGSKALIDAVAICTPPQARALIARNAIAAGLHVLLEKPPAATLAELGDLSRKAAATGVTLFAAWHSRFAPKVGEARDWLHGRTVDRGRVVWREDVRRWHPGQAWLWSAGGHGVFDPAINAFSILTSILSETVVVRSARLAVPENAHTPIEARLSLHVGTGEIAVDLSFLESGPQIWSIELDTRCGHRLQLSEGGRLLRIDGVGQVAAIDREYPALYSRFADLIDAGLSDADPAPLQLVADTLLIAETSRTPSFIE
jgi:D-galactose 1-dehydrogenase